LAGIAGKILAPPPMLSILTKLFAEAPQAHELVTSEVIYVANEKLQNDDIGDETRNRVQTLIGRLLMDEEVSWFTPMSHLSFKIFPISAI
jgi:hypothetical protein